MGYSVFVEVRQLAEGCCLVLCILGVKTRPLGKTARAFTQRAVSQTLSAVIRTLLMRLRWYLSWPSAYFSSKRTWILSLEPMLKNKIKSMVMSVCHPSTGEVVTGRSLGLLVWSTWQVPDQLKVYWVSLEERHLQWLLTPMHRCTQIFTYAPMYQCTCSKTQGFLLWRKITIILREIACGQRREAMRQIMPSLLILKNDVKSSNTDLFISEKAKHFIGKEVFFPCHCILKDIYVYIFH